MACSIKSRSQRISSKMLAYTKHDPSKLVVDLEKIDENENGATSIHTSPPGITTTEGPGATCESRIDTLLLDSSKPKQTRDFCATGSISATASQQLRCYLVNKCVFPDTPATKDAEGRGVSDKSFLEKASEKSALSNLYHFYSLYSARKYVEQFSNGITIISLYLNPVPNSNAPPIEHSIFQVMKEASLLYCLPENPFFSSQRLQATYAHCGYQCLQTIQPLSDEELYDKIRRTVPNKHSLQVLEFFLVFNKHILKTNFYQPTKVRDVARGGIRIVMRRNKEMYSINQRMLFDENYNLASTQSLKNKDILEGGAKGNRRHADPKLNTWNQEDAEDTADMTDWTALHTRDRNMGEVLHHWKECRDTQWSPTMTCMLGLKEKEITEVQTGGPDGDLGSNGILLSSDKTVAIIDGSGVLADPTGLDREELVRLAKKRLTVANFDRTKLSKDGYLVKVEEQDVKLPSGEIVLDGTDFRNGAHLRFKADLFVPCGGRPEAINISNMAALFDSEGKPHFNYIVEGANLFLTQQARLFLEKRKVVVFKDSSTNKGGVTSSSLEVLAVLTLSMEESVDLMFFKDGKPSEFYQNYVKDIQAKITQNAAAEFHCLWKVHTRLQGAKPRTTISDELSSTLNNLQAELESSDLFEDVPSRNGVMRRAIPKTLVEKIGLETLLKRLPEAYQRALFSSWVASHFLCKYGVNASSVDFFHFARDLSK
ncbi:NAD(P)-binding protein [Gymnopus androsaceus JB14]|uniref:NAD(P)-binding protein n=1 Tax=Gymnopus androsaceus JB14 TaxID=1447944 RepID=A0A6A4GWJ7_9AGAR|nr:NAD(P)-binding protein [Gymnopus androsaceus JB14]